MSDVVQQARDLIVEAGRLADESERHAKARRYEQAFTAMEQSQAADAEARLLAAVSGDEWLISQWP